MSPDQVIKIIETLVSLLQTLLWPLTIIILLLIFKKAIEGLLERIGKVTVSNQGVSVEMEKIEVASYLYASTLKTSEEKPETIDGTNEIVQHNATEEVQKIAKVVNQEITLESIKYLRKANILWVDDNPKNNNYKIKAFNVLGIQCTQVISTEEALGKVSSEKYNVIISDMSRNGQSREGFRLFDELKKNDVVSPYIIHSRLGVEKREEAKKKGIKYISDSEKLFQAVVEAILRKDNQK